MIPIGLVLDKSSHYAYSSIALCSALVIGANVMMHRDVVFDGGNGRIGFADANCTYRAFQSALESGNTASSSSRPSGDSSSSSSFVNGSQGGNGTASENADSQLASTAFRGSHLTAFFIGVGFIAFVLIVMAILLRRRGRTTRTRRQHYGGRDMHQVRVFDYDDDDNDGFEPGAPSIYDDNSEPKESFVTPHFLIHSPPALTARSPRNQILEEDVEWGYDGRRGERGRAHTLTFDRRARETSRGSNGLQRVEL